MDIINFEIPGKIKGKQRPLVTKNGTFTRKETINYENWVKSCYLQYTKKTNGNDERPLKVTITAIMPVPKSYTKREKLEIKYPKRKIDLDNIAKSVLDSLNGIAYKDDSQVMDLHITKEFGEEEDLDEWEIVDERPVDYDQEDALDKMIGLVSAGSPDPDERSAQDIALFKVRYQYAPIRNSANSREFCKLMEGAKLIYRKEDILQMGNQPVNAGFGPGGADTYNIWFYKGGSYCHHFWMRKTYMRKRNPQGQFLPNEGLENDKNISVNKAREAGFTPPVNDPKVATRPVDMPNGASLKNR